MSVVIVLESNSEYRALNGYKEAFALADILNHILPALIMARLTVLGIISLRYLDMKVKYSDTFGVYPDDPRGMLAVSKPIVVILDMTNSLMFTIKNNQIVVTSGRLN